MVSFDVDTSEILVHSPQMDICDICICLFFLVLLPVTLEKSLVFDDE